MFWTCLIFFFLPAQHVELALGLLVKRDDSHWLFSLANEFTREEMKVTKKQMTTLRGLTLIFSTLPFLSSSATNFPEISLCVMWVGDWAKKIIHYAQAHTNTYKITVSCAHYTISRRHTVFAVEVKLLLC